MGCCCRLRSSETSWMSQSSGACLPVSLAFMSVMHVFPRGHPMPVGQSCLGGTFSVFEVQPHLLNPGLMFFHCLKLCQLLGRLCSPPTLVLTVFHPRLVITLQTAKQRSHSPLFCPHHVPHTWIFSLAREFLYPCQPSTSSSSCAVALSPGLSAHRLLPGWVLITHGAGDVNPVPRPHLATSPQTTPGPAFSG